MVIIKIENEDEESKRVGKIWVDGEVLHQIALWGNWSLNLPKVWTNKVNSILLETLIVFVLIEFLKIILFKSETSMEWYKFWKQNKQKKKKQKNQIQIGPIEHFAFYTCPTHPPFPSLKVTTLANFIWNVLI